jgi:hypothetical protein
MIGRGMQSIVGRKSEEVIQISIVCLARIEMNGIIGLLTWN